ncbi:MAG: FAD-binding oxidoreductase, partial [Pseudobdellovibrionaceae bacterium]
MGRSYGDVCLNDDAVLLSTKNLNHYISFDKDLGIICCESGVSIDEILKLIVPHGWFIPVTPGTKFVTIGGALANDVHGKNHHLAGNFGHHVRQFELLRSNGNRLLCSRTQNSDLFFATIGGLGLTGLITWVEFNLKKISSAWIEQEQIQFRNLDEFFHLTLESEIDFEYTVSWVDC